jgi:ubiquinone/menaquinone biosynthesis C-methylase UbiE
MEEASCSHLVSLFSVSAEEGRDLYGPEFARYWRNYISRPQRVRDLLAEFRRIVRLTSAGEGMLLDCACGMGVTTLAARLCGANAAVGLDRTASHIEVARKLLANLPAPLSGAFFVRGDARRIGLGSKLFHAVILREAISHIDDLDALLAEVHRVLAPGGKLYVRDSNCKLDLPGLLLRMNLWRGFEMGARARRWPDGWKGFRDMRRRMIEEHFPGLDRRRAKWLARATKGLTKSEIITAVSTYLTSGALDLPRPEFPFRNPASGEFAERDFDPFSLIKRFRRAGFAATLLRPRFFYSPFTLGRAAVGAGLKVVEAAYPISLPVCPFFEILAVKES